MRGGHSRDRRDGRSRQICRNPSLRTYPGTFHHEIDLVADSPIEYFYAVLNEDLTAKIPFFIGSHHTPPINPVNNATATGVSPIARPVIIP